jgi:hypothetical protein
VSRIKTIPLTLAQANAYVGQHHRHSVPVWSHKFSIGAVRDGALVGVAIVGRPTARLLDDGQTLEISRVCTQGERNVCSFLYATCWRAMRVMGYRRAITYTRAYEHGASLKAAGFTATSRDRPGPQGSPRGWASRRIKPKEDTVRWEIAVTGEPLLSVTVSVTDERRCQGCGRALPRNAHGSRTHCGDACRALAYRRRNR